MKKKLVVLLIIVGILVIGFTGFKVFLGPTGFTSEDDLINSFIENVNSSTVCEDHFNEETLAVCEVFVTNLKNEELSISLINVTGDEAEVVLDINGNVSSFTFILITEEVTGIKGSIYSNYYLIDYIN